MKTQSAHEGVEKIIKKVIKSLRDRLHLFLKISLNILNIMVGQNTNGDDFDFSLNLEIDVNVDLYLLIFIFVLS